MDERFSDSGHRIFTMLRLIPCGAAVRRREELNIKATTQWEARTREGAYLLDDGSMEGRPHFPRTST